MDRCVRLGARMYCRLRVLACVCLSFIQYLISLIEGGPAAARCRLYIDYCMKVLNNLLYYWSFWYGFPFRGQDCLLLLCGETRLDHDFMKSTHCTTFLFRRCFDFFDFFFFFCVLVDSVIVVACEFPTLLRPRVYHLYTHRPTLDRLKLIRYFLSSRKLHLYHAAQSYCVRMKDRCSVLRAGIAYPVPRSVQTRVLSGFFLHIYNII